MNPVLEGQKYDDLTTAQIRLDYLRKQIVEAEAELAAAVRAQRTSGATWPEIGRRFGISKQAAQKRFG